MLVGRQAECAQLDKLWQGALNSRGGALVICGEPGIGKSSLLDYASQSASGMHVLRGRGVESEIELPYAVVHQVLKPLLGRLDQLPVPQARALEAALGMRVGSRTDRFLVALAVLSLLSETATDSGLLCLIDDAHWLDQPSADVFLFVGRRLETERVALLLTARDGPFTATSSGLTQLNLTGLDRDSARTLLAQRWPVAAAAVADNLVEQTRGNPLALVELPSVLTARQLAGAEPLPLPLPVGPGLAPIPLT